MICEIKLPTGYQGQPVAEWFAKLPTPKFLSKELALAYLAGAVDADGSITTGYQLQYTSTDPELILAVIGALQTLSPTINPNVYIKKPDDPANGRKQSYDLKLTPAEVKELCRDLDLHCPRKAQRLSDLLSGKHRTYARTAARVAEARQLRAQGLSWYAIAKRLGVDYRAPRRWLGIDDAYGRRIKKEAA